MCRAGAGLRQGKELMWVKLEGELRIDFLAVSVMMVLRLLLSVVLCGPSVRS
jgi:hypothetical protein